MQDIYAQESKSGNKLSGIASPRNILRAHFLDVMWTFTRWGWCGRWRTAAGAAGVWMHDVCLAVLRMMGVDAALKDIEASGNLRTTVQ